MKNLALILFFLAFAFTSFGQQAKTFIDTEYRFFSKGLIYYQDNKRLSNSELKSLMEVNSDTKMYSDKALKNGKVALPLYAISSVGLFTSIFIKDFSTQLLVGLSSTGVGFIGTIFEASYTKNMQKAVNLYNKNLIEDQRTGMRLDFKVDPLASGLVLTF